MFYNETDELWYGLNSERLVAPNGKFAPSDKYYEYDTSNTLVFNGSSWVPYSRPVSVVGSLANLIVNADGSINTKKLSIALVDIMTTTTTVTIGTDYLIDSFQWSVTGYKQVYYLISMPSGNIRTLNLQWTGSIFNTWNSYEVTQNLNEAFDAGSPPSLGILFDLRTGNVVGGSRSYTTLKLDPGGDYQRLRLQNNSGYDISLYRITRVGIY